MVVSRGSGGGTSLRLTELFELLGCVVLGLGGGVRVAHRSLVTT